MTWMIWLLVALALFVGWSMWACCRMAGDPSVHDRRFGDEG